MTQGKAKNEGVQKSVSKTLQILSTFNETSPLQRTTDIAHKLNMNVSTVSRHLNTMLDMGFLERDEESGRYHLGMEIISLVGAALQSNDIYRHSYPELQALTFKYGVHAHMSVPKGTNVAHMISISSERNTELMMPVGHVHPMYCSAMGRAILAFYSDETIDQKLKQSNIIKLTSETITSIDKIKLELKKIRQQGYCMIKDELTLGAASIAAPIFNRKRMPVGAISVSGSTLRLESDGIELELARAVRVTASKISAKLGYFPK